MEKSVVANETEEEEVTIYVKVTKTVALKAKESDTIGNVKALLHVKEGIPECLQQLYSKGNRLSDERKLADYGIIKNSTLHAYIEDSVPRTLLVKRPHAEGTITVYSTIYDTIQDVKSRIGSKERINSDEFSLIHDGKFLEDDKTLAFLKIDWGSTLHMVFNRRDKFLISVIMPTDETVQIEVKADLIVRDVKAVIESKVGRSMDGMELFCGIQKLEDLKVLYQYDIKEDSALKVMPEKIQIFIKKWCGGSLKLDVHRYDLVTNVKRMLLKKLRIPVHLQKLVFEGKFLADSQDLASYNIQKDSNVFLDFRNSSEHLTSLAEKRRLLSTVQINYHHLKLCTITDIGGSLSSTTSIARLKELIGSVLKQPVKALILGDELLDDVDCLGDCGITKDTELVVGC